MQELKETSNQGKKQLERKELTKLMSMGTSSLQNVAEHKFMITNKPPKQKKNDAKPSSIRGGSTGTLAPDLPAIQEKELLCLIA